MLAPQVEDVANTGSATIDLLKICDFKGLVAKTYANRASASQITVYNPSTQLYTYYYYTSGNGGTGWRANPAAPTTLIVPVGSGVWLKVGEVEGDASVTLSGSVNAAESVTVNIGDQGVWSIVSNPYPTALTIGMINTTGITAQSYANRASASQICVYNPTTQLYSYFYYVNGNGVSVWRSTPAVPTESTVICEPGAAFWVKSPTSGSITFSLNK
jgi:hypothetical protein